MSITTHLDGHGRLLAGARVWIAIVLILATLCGVCGSLRDRPLETHEVYVAQTAREMLAANELVTPIFNAVERLNKPPLMYWCVIAVAKVLPGAHEVPPWAARLPSAAASVLMALATIVLGRAVYDRRTAVLGALMGIGSVGWLSYANNARPEMLYGALSVAMLACLVKGHRSSSVRWALAGWIFGGLALLAKGPQIPTLLLLGLVAHLAIAGELRAALKSIRPFVGLPLMVAVALPWAVALIAETPQGPTAWAADLFAGRELDESKGAMNFLSPFYLYATPGLVVPWAIFVPFGLASVFVRGRPDLHRGRALFWPLVITVVVMGLFNHRRDYYLLALMPLLTLLSARGILDLVETRLSPAAATRTARGLIIAAVAGVLICAGLGATDWVWGTKRFRDWAFARTCAEQAAKPSDVVLCFGTDFAKVVYARNRPVRVVRTFEEALAAAAQVEPSGRVFLLTTADRFAGQTVITGTTVARAEIHQGDNADVLIELTGDTERDRARNQ